MPKCGTDLPEQQVTDDMSLLVIALLQMVDVDEGENQWLSDAVRAADGLRELVVTGMAHQRPRELVAVGIQ